MVDGMAGVVLAFVVACFVGGEGAGLLGVRLTCWTPCFADVRLAAVAPVQDARTLAGFGDNREAVEAAVKPRRKA